MMLRVLLFLMFGVAALVPQVPTESEVYRTVLRDRIHGIPVSDFVVTTTPRRLPAVTRVNRNWFKQFDGMPDGLLTSLLDPPPAAPHFEPGSFPEGTRFVSEEAVRRLFAPGIRRPWVAFKKELKVEGWITFSNVVLTRDALDALVYYEGWCEGLCGEGVFAWLRRDSPEKKWTIKRRITRWIS